MVPPPSQQPTPHAVPQGMPPPYDPGEADNYHAAFAEQNEAAEAGEEGGLLSSAPPSSSRRQHHRTRSRPNNSSTNNNSDSDIDSLLESDTDDEERGGPRRTRNESMESVRREMEQFDIEDPASTSRPSFSARASLASQRIAVSLSSKLISPVQRMLDPIAALFRYASMKFDTFISRFGNPLILKRLLYLFFVFLMIYLAFESGILPGSTKDAFGGEYYDRDQLVEFLTSSIRADAMKERTEYMSSMPHLAGTAGDLTLAKYVEDQMISFGMKQVAMTEHSAYISYPNDTATAIGLQLLGDNPYTATMTEDLMYDHPSTSQVQPKPFHALSAAGEVQGPLVYVNYGTKEDFEMLQLAGISVQGCIVIMRNGKMELGLKARLAEMAGAVGVITFTDKANTDAAWPAGPGAPEGAVERGSMAISALIPGDILSPGYSSIASERVVDDASIINLPRIPAVPVSWRDVKPFLEATRGYGVKVDAWASLEPQITEWWTGNQTGPQAKLANYPIVKERHPIWNVRSKLDGLEQSELVVIIGAKRDAWCYGAAGSASGTSVMLEVARIFTLMSAKLKWVPLRSIYFASWDGGDQNLAGTTEWVEYNINTLRQTGLAYINLDNAISGPQLDITGHPMLKTSMWEVLQTVTNPNTNQSYGEQWQPSTMKVFDKPTDHIPFLAYAGIASVDMGFKKSDTGAAGGAPEHSCFDSVEWMNQYGDPGFQNHYALAEMIAKLVLKLADDPVIPLDIGAYADALDDYTNDLMRYAQAQPTWSTEGAAALGMLEPLREAASKIRDAYTAFISWRDTWVALVSTAGEPPAFMHFRWSWNARLVNLDKHLLDYKGIPARKWFKHIVFGPQLWHPTEGGYLWGTFPAVRDAIEAADWHGAKEAAARIGAIILLAASKLPL